MIRELGESGVTVLLSSHILAEVQQVCHSVSIIGNGRLLASGAVDDLVGAGDKQVRVGVADPGPRSGCSSEAGFASSREGDRAGGRGGRACRGRHPDAGASAGIYVRELRPVRADLEAVFLRLTADGRTTRGSPPASRGRREVRMRLLRVELSRLRLAPRGGAAGAGRGPAHRTDRRRPPSGTPGRSARPSWRQPRRRSRRCSASRSSSATCRPAATTPRQFFGGRAPTAADCEANLVPRPKDYLNRSALDLGEQQRGTGSPWSCWSPR